MTEVAIRNSHWHSLSVFHELNDDGEVDCRFSGRDMQFRVVDLETLPEHVELCSDCSEEDYHAGSNSPGWAAKLRAADDPEEVLRG